MAKAVKLKDIADKFGVSNVTVSKALSGQKGVSEEMREKIVAYADELGYKQPSVRRRESGRNKSYNIGVLIEERYLDKYDSFYWQMYQNIATKAVERECFTLLEVVGAYMEESLELPKILKEGKVEGLIIVGRPQKKYLKFLQENLRIPVVYFDFSIENPDADSVISDSFYGGYHMANYLLEMGHKKIGYVGTLLATESITDRYLGFTRALMENGIRVRNDWVINDRDPVSGNMSYEDFFKLPREMPTAFLCNCDLAAANLIKKLRESGYQVPEDVSVVGYDDYLYPGLCNIGITTYQVDVATMAEKAIDLIIKRIAGEIHKTGVTIVDGQIVIRDSVKAIN